MLSLRVGRPQGAVWLLALALLSMAAAGHARAADTLGCCYCKGCEQVPSPVCTDAVDFDACTTACSQPPYYCTMNDFAVGGTCAGGCAGNPPVVPTPTVTSSPTDTPTVTPTPVPTETPTLPPTERPTDTPTISPLPTDTPTPGPTQPPTLTPTEAPTVAPTPSGTPTNTPTVTATGSPTLSPTQTPTGTTTGTPTVSPTITVTNSPTSSPTQTPTRTASGTPTITSTPSQTPTRTSTSTPTLTRTPTSTATITPTPTPPPPQITGGAETGSTTVSGSSIPNATPGNHCITIYDCGTDEICDPATDTPIGTGDADAQGHFVVTVSPPLIPGQRIYAVDTCNSLVGPAVLVAVPTPAPAMSTLFLGALVLVLGGVGILGRARSSTS